jgi:hypothetical protein
MNKHRAAVAACAVLAGCSEQGAVAFSSWGEEFIEQEIPASELADGFSVKYSKFFVLIGNIEVADESGEVVAKTDRFLLMDHVEPGVKPVVRFDGIASGAYTHVSYETSPAPRDKIDLVGNVSSADADMMAAQALHVYVEGAITDPTGAAKTFQWGFGVPTLLDECEGEQDGKLTPGVVVTDGGEDVVELTIHGDHFFYDNLQAASAVLRAQAIFDADADMNGAVTLHELAAVPLVMLPPDQYGTGGAPDVNDLRAFVTFLSRTLGHFRGEGECFLKTPT